MESHWMEFPKKKYQRDLNFGDPRKVIWIGKEIIFLVCDHNVRISLDSQLTNKSLMDILRGNIHSGFLKYTKKKCEYFEINNLLTTDTHWTQLEFGQWIKKITNKTDFEMDFRNSNVIIRTKLTQEPGLTVKENTDTYRIRWISFHGMIRDSFFPISFYFLLFSLYKCTHFHGIHF